MSDVLASALLTVCRQMNSELRAIEPNSRPWVALLAPTEAVPDQLKITVLNLTQEASARNYEPVRRDDFRSMQPPLHLEVTVRIAADFIDVPHGLRVLGRAVNWCRQHNVLTPADTPDLDPAIARLSIEMLNLSLGEALAAAQLRDGIPMPAIFLRIRGIAFGAQA
ncbi:Pvc16 family protein [Sphingomonas sp. AOB5]|uniref:Pvc16 family protein n=1 Tax=Sphingomonas sp. AOB5 TaxID=3034017 RepID=UPI0023F7BC0C|nr:Pvc16 family protein [Sphingomonas sp. AOB5]MDF7777279.1 Pvc16 family protein [Sphingomonas sp. AOB5]